MTEFRLALIMDTKRNYMILTDEKTGLWVSEEIFGSMDLAWFGRCRLRLALDLRRLIEEKAETR